MRALVSLSILLAGCASAARPRSDAGDAGDAAQDVSFTPTDASDTPTVPTDGPASDLIVWGAGLSAYEGRTAYVALYDSALGHATQVSSASVAGGGFMISWPDSFRRDEFGMDVYVYVDADGDGHCTAADPNWGLFVSNDFGMGTVFVHFAPDNPAIIAGRCDLFP